MFQKELCKTSVKNRHFKNFLCFYIYSSFDSEFIFKCYILKHKFYFSRNVKTDTSGKFFFSAFVSSVPVNLNQYRGTVGVFNNRNIAFCIFCSIWYSKSFQNCSTFIFFNAIFLCAAYLFALLECLKSSFFSSLRVKFRTIHTCLNIILYISILLLYANRFWLYEIVLKLSGDIEENPGPKPSSNQ